MIIIKKTIKMLSSADKVAGQGVGAAYLEQVALVKDRYSHKYNILVNERGKADLIHYHTIDPQFFLKKKTAGKNCVNLGYVHFLPETVDTSLNLPWIAKKVFYKYMISFYKSMDMLVTVNPYFIERLASYGVDESKVRYIPNFVSEKDFFVQTKSDRNATREKFGINEDAFVVLSVGQLQTRKGVMEFVEIAKSLPKLTFIWAGGFSFGKTTSGYSEIKKVVDNPPENIKFLGILPREEMNDIYNMADVMFLASFEELFPMCILESMNCKKPILLRDLVLYENILFDYYLKGNNNDEFIQILTDLKKDKSFYESACRMSWRGHEFYSRDHVAKMWEELYDKLLDDEVINE